MLKLPARLETGFLDRKYAQKGHTKACAKY